MRIVQIAAEVAPYSKTGGLGDVVGALGPALGRRGHRVLTVTPRYGGIDAGRLGAVPTGFRWGIHAAGARHDVSFSLLEREHDDVLFVEHPMFGGRAGIYGDQNGGFGDNHIRFSVLVRAALEAARRIPVRGEPMGEDVVLHAHDWHTSLLPVYLEAIYRPLGLFERAPTVLTVHNVAHQGRMGMGLFADLELPPRFSEGWCLEWYGDICLLKAGLAMSEAITTVSPTFAHEMASRDGGFGLDPIVRHRWADVTGILNGIDADVWDPSTDPLLPARFDVDDLSGKAECKATLQAELGLPIDPSRPLLGSVGRLDPQKGVELLLESIPWMVQMGAQVVVLGSAGAANAHYEHQLRELERTWPRHVRAWIGFNERVAHQIEAGADLFVMPSRFEPCGLNQMYSMRYGTVPVVRSTGGLVDSVRTPEEVGDRATGFRFGPYSGYALREQLYRALRMWSDDPDAFDRLRANGMALDWSWDATIPRYEEVYRRAGLRRGLPVD